MDVEVSDQVAEYIRRQPPEPRRRLRSALRGLAAGRGDIKSLEGPLSGYCRLRVGGHRVLLAYGSSESGAAVIKCIFAERRDLVYEIFQRLVEEQLRGRRRPSPQT